MDQPTELRALKRMPPQPWEEPQTISKYQPTTVRDIPRSIQNVISEPSRASLSDLLYNTGSIGDAAIKGIRELLGEPGQLDVGGGNLLAPFYRLTTKGKGIFHGSMGESSKMPELLHLLKYRFGTLPGPRDSLVAQRPIFRGPMEFVNESMKYDPSFAGYMLGRLLSDPDARFVYTPYALKLADYGGIGRRGRIERLLEKLPERYPGRVEVSKYADELEFDPRVTFEDPYQLVAPEHVLSEYLLK